MIIINNLIITEEIDGVKISLFHIKDSIRKYLLKASVWAPTPSITLV